MRIIVCGAGPVGRGIARQLSYEENDVTIVDYQEDALERVRDTLDVSTVKGFPSHPNILEDAGANDAEMIIGVTSSDEVNMIICQIAHSIFNIPIKIARIRHQNYLMPMWKDLYRHDHLPVDYIISPEQEIARAIINRLHVPGAMDSIPFVDERLKVIEVRCGEECPLINNTVETILWHADGLHMSIVLIVRNGQLIFANPQEKLLLGDELFFVAPSQNVSEIMSLFGHEEKEARRVLIIGGGNIGMSIAQLLENEEHDINTKLIELDRERAEYVASKLPHTTVINGDSLSTDILQESNIEATETVIAVTNDDEVNILSSLLAKRRGSQRAFALVNKGASYGSLMASLGIDVMVDPREMTVSSVLQYTRKGKIIAAHPICMGQAEILEAMVVPHSAIIGKSLAGLGLPKGTVVASIVRGEEIITPNDKTIIRDNDRLLIFTSTQVINKLDIILSKRSDYF